MVPLLLSLWTLGEPARFEFSEPHMGTTFRVVAYAPDRPAAAAAAKAAFARVAELNSIMSDYDPASELMRLCRANPEGPGQAVRVSEDLFTVLRAGQRLSEKSGGAFDVTVGPLSRLWRSARRTQQLPSPAELADAKSRSGWRNLELNESARTVRLLKGGMRLDLGGIAKGYAADAALAVLAARGVTSALVAAGGDVAVSGPPPGATGWRVEIAPLTKASPKRTLNLANAAVSTSGDAEQFVEIGGVRYSHIVDPRTGLGVVGRKSVSVIARRGVDADSTTKAVTLLPLEQGLAIVESLESGAAIVVEVTPEGERTTESKRVADYRAR